MAKRKRKKHHQDQSAGILPTPERAQHNGGLTREVRDSNESESIRIIGLRARYECRLDEWLGVGMLGRGDVAQKRHDAGMWLRGLYLKTHPESQVCKYERRSSGGGDGMTDEQAWNFACLQDTFRHLGKCQTDVERVACYDQPGSVESVREGLDMIRRLRFE